MALLAVACVVGLYFGLIPVYIWLVQHLRRRR